MRPPIPLTCHHGGEAGVLRDGVTKRCPSCRREDRRARAEAERKARALERDEKLRAIYEQPGW